MVVQAALMITFAIGHASFATLAINTIHGFGIKDRFLEPPIRFGLLAIMILTPLAGVWLCWHPWTSWPSPVQLYAGACVVMALVVLPTVTIRRALRKTPAGISGRSIEVNLAETLGLETLIGEGRHSSALRLPGNQSFQLRREEWRVEVPGLPAGLSGLSILQVSDLHFAHCYSPAFFEAVAEEVGKRDADLVFFTGDLIDDDSCLPWIAPIFSRMRGEIGQFAILGNHDYSHDGPRILRELERGGFEDIDGRWRSLHVGNSTIAIGGTSHPWGPLPDPSEMPEAEYRILLSHTPDMLYHASNWGVDLMLSGHNHGGQIRLPILGPILMPSRYSRRFDMGFFRHRQTLLYVSRGVGGKDPIRYGAVPEITRFVLQPAPTASKQRGSHSRSRKARLVPGGA